jgi:hypothetical protein
VRGWLGEKNSHGMSKKVSGRIVGGAELGGGETMQCSTTLTVEYRLREKLRKFDVR